MDISNELALFAYYTNISSTTMTRDTLQASQTYIEFMFSNKQEEMKRMIDSVDAASKKDFNGNHRYITLGAEFRGGVSNGRASIFSNGSLASSGSINGLVGYNWDRMDFRHNTDALVKKRIIINNLDFKNSETAIRKELTSLVDAGALAEGGMADYLAGLSEKSPSEKIRFINARLRLLENPEYDPSGETLANKEQLEHRNNLLNQLFAKSEEGEKFAKELRENFSKNESNIKKNKNLKKEINAILSHKDLEGLIFIHINDPYTDSEWTTFKKDIESKTYKNKIILALYDSGSKKDYDYSELIKLYKSFRDTLKDYQKAKDEYDKELGTHARTNRHLVYVRAGFTGSSFKYDFGRDSTTVGSRFKTREFDGYKVDIGYTGQYNVMNYVGLGASVGYTNNVSDLAPATFTLTTKDTTITSGEFTSSETVKALSGLYDEFIRYDLNVDFVHLFRLKEQLKGKTSQLYLSLNPYLRHHIYQDSETMINKTILGIGAYAYSSEDNKIMGGLYIQSDDVFDNDSPAISTLSKRIQFGLVARFGFTGLKPKK